MYVLTFVDGINIFSSSTTVTDGIEVLGVSDSVQVLKDSIHNGEGTGVDWTYNNDSGQHIGLCTYEGEVEEEQYYVICKVKQF